MFTVSSAWTLLHVCLEDQTFCSTPDKDWALIVFIQRFLYIFLSVKGRLRTDLVNGNHTEMNDSEDENGRIFIWLVGWLILLLKGKRERRKEKMRGRLAKCKVAKSKNKNAFFKKKYILLKDNCFTEFCRFLSKLSMNQP